MGPWPTDLPSRSIRRTSTAGGRLSKGGYPCLVSSTAKSLRSGFLDDLFVDPPRRGVGVARALLGALAQIGRAEEWNSLSWMTAEDNYRARALYDQVATKTIYLTYRMTL
jgi:GNAT superfamily N-acetyltransferase